MSTDKDLFKDYGAQDKSILELIEEFSVALLLKGLTAPKKIVFDKHTMDAYKAEFQGKIAIPKENPKLTEDVVVSRFETAGGRIEIVEG